MEIIISITTTNISRLRLYVKNKEKLEIIKIKGDEYQELDYTEYNVRLFEIKEYLFREFNLNKDTDEINFKLLYDMNTSREIIGNLMFIFAINTSNAPTKKEISNKFELLNVDNVENMLEILTKKGLYKPKIEKQEIIKNISNSDNEIKKLKSVNSELKKDNIRLNGELKKLQLQLSKKLK